MKNCFRIFILLLLCLWASQAKAVTNPSVVHTCQNLNTSGTSVTCTLGGTQTTNNAIIISCSFFPSTFTSATLVASDSSSNTYALDSATSPYEKDATLGGAINTSSTVIASGGGSAITPQCATNIAASFIAIIATEVSGLPTSSIRDSHTDGAIASSAANAFIQALSGSGNASSAANTFSYSVCETEHAYNTQGQPGPATTLINTVVDGGAPFMMAEYALFYGAGNQNPTYMTGTSGTNNTACNVVAYKFNDQTPFTGVWVANGGGFFTGVGGTTNSPSWTHVTAGCSNSLLVMSAHYNAGAQTLTVTYNSAALTNFSQLNDTSVFFTQELWRKVAPTSGSNTMSVSFTTAREGFWFSEDLCNVNQVTPIAGLQTSTAQSTGANTLTVTSAVNDLVLSYQSVDAQPSCYNGITDFSFPLSELPVPYFGHTAGASSVTDTWTIIGGGFPSVYPIACPGTAIGSLWDQTHAAFDVQVTQASVTGSRFGNKSKLGGNSVVH